MSILWAFAVPALLAGLLYGPVTWAAATILAHQPGGYGELGIFNAANQWRTLIMFVPSAVGMALLPVLSSLHAEGDIPRAVRALKAHLYFSALTGFACALPLALGSYWIMATYGRDFRGGWPALVFLAVAAVLQAMNNVVGQALASFNRMWIGFVLNALWAAELLGGTFLLRTHGARGLALAYCLAYALHTIQQATVVAAFVRTASLEHAHPAKAWIS
jgi:O-antigen/teichoic acid export membrane protein